MDSFNHEMSLGNRTRCFLVMSGMATTLGVLIFWISSLLFPEIASATTIYSYIDEQGTPVLTDNFETIPERYRAKVRVTEQTPTSTSKHSAAVQLQQKMTDLAHNTDGMLGSFAPSISGFTPYQSRVLSYGGIAAVFCLLARLFVKGQTFRFLSLWALIMLGLTVPALFFTSLDAPLDRLSGQAGQIQEKQQEHLQHAP
jgi:hypothetical protein